jgi:NAD(P)-dependent dehydrogenase (short-subunit alcohol dehydrogenase family)
MQVLPSKSLPRLRSDGSYLIVGGLGGIGRSLCEWLTKRGAEHLILLSRSGKSASGSGPFMAELEAAGCEVRAVACDVASEQQLTKALESCSDMPPVRGVIQAAMLLRVCYMIESEDQ